MTDALDEALWRVARRHVIEGGLRIDGFGQLELRRRARTSTIDPQGAARIAAQPTFVPDPALVACVAGGPQPAAYEAARVVTAVATAMATSEAAVRDRLDATVRAAVRAATDRARPRPTPLGTLGVFHVRDYAAYETRNPRGEAIQVPAKRVAAFTTSRTLFELSPPATAPADAVTAVLAAWTGDVATLGALGDALQQLPGPLSPADQIRVIDLVADRLGDGWIAASDTLLAALPL